MNANIMPLSFVWTSTFHPCSIPKLKIITDLIAAMEYDTVADLGCGDGELSYWVTNTPSLIGIDISADMMKTARGRLPHAIIADMETSIPLRSETIDLLLAVDIIEHLAGTDNFLVEIYRVLDSSGKLVLVTPNLASLTERFLLLLGYQPQNVEVSKIRKFGSIKKTPPVGHFRGFTWSAVREILQYYRFSIDDFRVTTYYTGLFRFLDLAMGRIRKTFASLFIVLCSKRSSLTQHMKPFYKDYSTRLRGKE